MLSVGRGDEWKNVRRIHRRSLRWGTKSTRHRSKWYELGLFYDYPPCCVREFWPCQWSRAQRRAMKIRRELKQERSWKPCERCARGFLRVFDY